MTDMTIIQGTQLDLKVEQFDSAATSVDFIMKNDDTDVVYTTNATYTAGEAQIHISGLKTAIVGTYSYQLNENTPTGKTKYGVSNCVECEFGKVYICEALDGAVS